MSNKLCLYERGNFTEPEMCNVWLKNSISNNFCEYSFIIASVGFNIDRTHTPKCVENCFDSKVSYNYLSNFYETFCNVGYNSEHSVFSQPWTNYFVMNLCLPCAQTVTLGKQDNLFVKLMRFKNS